MNFMNLGRSLRIAFFERPCGKRGPQPLRIMMTAAVIACLWACESRPAVSEGRLPNNEPVIERETTP